MIHSPQSVRLKQNNFDLLRLVFALMVCLVHTQTLSGHAELLWISQYVSSQFAVKAFFVVSGFLIFMSYENSSSLGSYFDKRLRRIYPGYVTVILLSAFLMSAISTLPLSQYFSLDWLKYLVANLLFLNFVKPVLPGVFQGHALSEVNGALWTLKIEVMFYLSVPVIVWLFRRFGHLWVIAVLYALSIGYSMVLTEMSRQGTDLYAQLARQLPGQLSYFLSGALFYYYLPFFERHFDKAVFLLAVCLVAVYQFSLLILEPLALAGLVVFLALAFYLGNAGKYGDFSYGIYIIHVPVIQTLLHFGAFKQNPYGFLGVVLAVTFIGSFLLWHLAEKRFLRRSSHYGSAQ